MVRTTAVIFCLCLALFSLTGCEDKPARVIPPSLNAGTAGKAAITEYDKDGDGGLSAEEMAMVPGILEHKDKYDRDGDGKVTSAEIAARIEEWQASRLAITSYPARVTINGEPFAGAKVELVPEGYLGSTIEGAEGTSDEYGFVDIAIPKDKLPEDGKTLHGVRLGVYKVRVTHPEKNVPARFNTETVLGVEVAPDHLGMESPVFDVSM